METHSLQTDKQTKKKKNSEGKCSGWYTIASYDYELSG